MTLSEAFENFILEKTLQGLSEESMKSYHNTISVFLNHVGKNLPIDSVTKEVVNDFILHQMKRGLSKATVATYIRNARIFLCYINDDYPLSFEPKKIKIPKTPKKKVRVYTDEEITVLFQQIKTSIPWITARNRAIVALMLDSGIRQGEVCTLLSCNVDFAGNRFKVIGKGAKERYVPLGEFSKGLLMEYLEECPFKNETYVFLDRAGKPVTRNAVRLFVNRLKHQLGLDISSHKFRHNFATNYCLDNLKNKGGTNVYDLSIIMGHESIETTKKYEHFAHELVAVNAYNSHLDAIFKNQVSLGFRQ